MKYYLVLVLLMCQHFFLSAQSKTDSLQHALAASKADTNRVNLQLKLAMELKKKDPARSITYTEEAIELSKKLDFKRGMARGYHRLGLQYSSQQEYYKAREYFALAEKGFLALKDIKNLGQTHFNVGKSYYAERKIDSALIAYFKGLELFESIKDSANIGMVSVSIGEGYSYQGNHDKAISYLETAVKCDLKSMNPHALAISLGNLGAAYVMKENEEKALEYFKRALEFSIQDGDKYLTASMENNIASVYMGMGKYENAEGPLHDALEKFKETDKPDAVIAAMNNIGICSFNLGRFDEAEAMLKSALAMAQEQHNLLRTFEVYQSLSEMSAKKNDYEKAYGYLQQMMDYKDSVSGQETSERILEIEGKYNAEKQAKEIELLTKQKEVSNLEQSRQRLLIYFVLAGLVLVVVLVIVLYNRYRIKRKAHREISEQKEIVDRAYTSLNEANIQINEKNREITDSINYAKRIQEAILPARDSLASLLPESFIVYQPKDIVSGDFYWFTLKNGKILIAAADCTGHGVPGALMSMIGNDKLHETINEKGIVEPSEVLMELDKKLIHVLNQDGASTTRDGMDIALLSIDTRDQQIIFSAANRPLYHFDAGGMTEIKGTKLPVGGGMYGDKQFTSTTLQAAKGDTFYIFSDGFADQFGGENGKKFTTSRFKKLLADVQHLPMKEQGDKLHSVLNEWRGPKEQVDDVLVIGFRL